MICGCPGYWTIAHALRFSNRSIHAGSEVDDSEETPEKQDGADRWHPDQIEYKFNVEKVDNHPAEAKTGDKDGQNELSTEATKTDASSNDTVTPTSETNEPANQDTTGEHPATEQTKSVRKKFNPWTCC